MKKIILLVTFIVTSLFINAQNEASNWYFGDNSGIRFNPDGTTTPLIGSLGTDEGCASISDGDGRLLFYTDGSDVFDRDNNRMPNGFGLFGDQSSTQSALIVPKPEDPNIYYIFTVDTVFFGNPDFGFNYSVVDLRLNNGLGDVTEKNINLLQNSSEKLSAVLKDCESKSIWVVTFSNEFGTPRPENTPNSFNTFHAFEVTTTGVNVNAVKSTLSLNISDQRGYLKFSPNGTKLACANSNNGLYLFDFDTDTGIVSSTETIPTSLNIPSNNGAIFPYGVEFSQNGQFLYVSSSNNFFAFNDNAANNNPANHFSSLVQFDISVPNIQSSAILLDQNQAYRSALQLGPDGKIYRTTSNTYNQGLPFLSVINNPNERGQLSNYQENAIQLTNNSRQGLPPFITSFFTEKIDIINDPTITSTSLPLCDGDTYTLSAEVMSDAIYTWSFNGETQPQQTPPNEFVVSTDGLYSVLIEFNNGDCETFEGEAFVTYSDIPEANDITLSQCDEFGAQDGISIFNLNEFYDQVTGNTPNRTLTFFPSLNDAQNNQNAIDPIGYENSSPNEVLTVRVVNNMTQCENFAQIILDISFTSANDALLRLCDTDGTEDGFVEFDLSLANEQVLNGLQTGLDVTYYETLDDALLEINPLQTSFTNTTAFNQTIFVRVENQNNCFGINEVELEVLTLPNVETSFETLYCLNNFPEPIVIDGGVINAVPNNFFYQWSTGETTNQIEVNEPGTYTVVVSNVAGCSKERTVVVNASNIATINDIEVNDASQNNTITVLVTGEGDYEFSLNDPNGLYQDSNVFENVRPGIYTVFVRDINGCGISEELVSVVGFPKFFTPNGDNQNDFWQVNGISSQFQPGTVIYIFDRYGKLLSQINPIGSGWDGTYNGALMPSDDYWFSVTLQDGRRFSSHFALKR